MHWDVFCKVVDNFGDIGVCWRLAADLAARAVPVRLWVDDAAALAWLAPQGAAGVSVRPWSAAASTTPGRVVIETFGCGVPDAFLRRMAAQGPPPLWIDLEHLSAEAFVERSHRLPSPQFGGAAAGLTRWFFYPGFTARTGGLLREADLGRRQQRFDAAGWLRPHGIARAAHEQVVSLFCYDNPALPALLDALAAQPTLLLATAGPAARQVAALLGPGLARGGLRAQLLPLLDQPDYDHLLWSCDLNFVRGEDSFVRAQWAGVPFVWQAYPQHDGAHAAKLQAFIDRFRAGVAAPDPLRRLFAAWNGLTPPAVELPPLPAWRAHCLGWRAGLLAQADLVRQLLGFAAVNR